MPSITSLALITEASQHRVIATWHSSKGYPTSVYYDEADFLRAVDNLDQRALLLVGWNSTTTLGDRIALMRDVVKRCDRHSYIVAVSDSTIEQDVVSALETGADRFLSTELSFRIINALLDALVRPDTEDTEICHFPPYVMNLMTREVEVEGNCIRLTPGEFRIARYLFENSDSILSREVMLREVWGLPNLQYNRRVDTKISHVRRKMYLDGTYGWKLKYPRGQGYQLLRSGELADTDQTSA